MVVPRPAKAGRYCLSSDRRVAQRCAGPACGGRASLAGGSPRVRDARSGAGDRNGGRLFGVRASQGGQHPGEGTRNALVALGPASYFEIIGPDPEQPRPERGRRFGVDEIKAPRLTTWVAKGAGLEAFASNAAAHGVNLGAVISGSRKRPDGVVLSWRYTRSARRARGPARAVLHRLGGLAASIGDGDTRRDPARPPRRAPGLRSCAGHAPSARPRPDRQQGREARAHRHASTAPRGGFSWPAANLEP